MKVFIVCLNPTFQRTMFFEDFQLGEVNRCKKIYFDASGKGVNIARILSQKGMKSKVLTQLNKSQEKKMLSLCENDKVSLLYSLCDAQIRTCTTILSDNYSATELVEEAYPVSEKCSNDIETLFNKNIDNYDALIITGTRAKGFSEDIYKKFVKIGKLKNKLVIVDLCKEELIKCLDEGVNIIKPNLSEFVLTFFNKKINENDDNEFLKNQVIEKMKELYESKSIISIITRSSYPIWIYSKNGFLEVPIKKSKKAINTIGCGDTFTALLTYSLLNKLSLEDSIKAAVEAASLNSESIRPASLY